MALVSQSLSFMNFWVMLQIMATSECRSKQSPSAFFGMMIMSIPVWRLLDMHGHWQRKKSICFKSGHWQRKKSICFKSGDHGGHATRQYQANIWWCSQNTEALYCAETTHADMCGNESSNFIMIITQGSNFRLFDVEYSALLYIANFDNTLKTDPVIKYVLHTYCTATTHTLNCLNTSLNGILLLPAATCNGLVHKLIN
jgi:hypothetical protein